MPKITAILPVYNVGAYIRECLDSIKNQTFSDFEVICIDDCSNDNSVEIIDEFVKNDSRFNLIKHSINQGPGVARNTGLDNAKGEYVIFIDPDDIADVNLFEKVYSTFKETDVDCIWYNAEKYDEKTKKTTVIFPETSIFNHDGYYDITPQTIYKGADYVWNKAFKLSVIEKYNLRFPNMYLGEDGEFYFKAFTNIKRIYYINRSLYTYRTRVDSIVDRARVGTFNMKSTFDVYMNIHNYCMEKGILKEYRNALCHLIVTRINNRSIEGQNEIILRQAKELLEKINFPECFSLEN